MSEETPDILPDAPEVDTIGQHLSEISPLLTEGDIRVVLRKRKLAYDTPYDDLSEREVDLAEAEAYYKLCDQPVGGATHKEVDGSWSSTQGGWTVSGENLRRCTPNMLSFAKSGARQCLGNRQSKFTITE